MTIVLRKIKYKNIFIVVLFEFIVFNNKFAWLQIAGDNIRYFNNDETSAKFLASLNNEKNVFADIIVNKNGKIIYNRRKNKLD
jgi:hypothetical protein